MRNDSAQAEKFLAPRRSLPALLYLPAHSFCWMERISNKSAIGRLQLSVPYLPSLPLCRSHVTAPPSSRHPPLPFKRHPRSIVGAAPSLRPRRRSECHPRSPVQSRLRSAPSPAPRHRCLPGRRPHRPHRSLPSPAAVCVATAVRSAPSPAAVRVVTAPPSRPIRAAAPQMNTHEHSIRGQVFLFNPVCARGIVIADLCLQFLFN